MLRSSGPVLDKVAVLMATYNGQSYVSSQLDSLAMQVDVSSQLYVSDDGSTDATMPSVLRTASELSLPITLLSNSKNFQLSARNSANNFYHLIANVVPPPDVRWVALSDQDDIWMPNHLIRAISLLKVNAAAGYSASVVAFWPDGSRRLVKKHGFISPRNHLFESPGPGCSIVLPRHIYDQLQNHLRTRLAKASLIDFHDWAIFAYVRAMGGTWIIDSEPSLLYRQHSANVLGVQLGLANLSKRFMMLAGGWYREQVLSVADFCDQQADSSVQKLLRLSPLDRLALSLMAFRVRRRTRDKILLAAVFLFMRKNTR